MDLNAGNPEWRILASRMKMRDEHVVPLPRQAVDRLRLSVNGPSEIGLLSVQVA
jgi:integrase